MRLHSIDASMLSIAFKFNFKHASAERAATQSLWVEAAAQSGQIGFGEGCPREYVSGENAATALAFVDAHRDDWLSSITDEQSLKGWVERHPAIIDRNPAAWTAVELALLDLLGKERNRSIEALLGLETLGGRFLYTAVLGDGSPHIFRLQLDRYLSLGLTGFKIKLSGSLERDAAKVRDLADRGIPGHAVRADANNLWQDADTAAAHILALHYPFAALEEPLRREDVVGLRRLARQLKSKIVLDESLLREEQLDRFAESSDRWLINLRVSKMGGVLRSLRLLKALRERGLRVIIGAHVGETSVLTRAALTTASCARNILVAQEGAFGTHLLSADVAQPPLMFGAGGMIDVAGSGIAQRPGLGLEVSSRQAVECAE